MPRFGRLITAMVTPMKADLSVDYGRAAALARRLVAAGSEGLVVSGTTGESPTLSEEEKLKLFETVVEAVGDRAKVIAGTGNYNTAESIHLSQAAEAVGVHGLLLVGPYYNKPPQEGYYRHFRAIAEKVRLPIMLYNVPTRTSGNILPETIVRLARDVPNIVAVKEASGNVDQSSFICREAPAGFEVLSGDDFMTMPIMVVGGVGIVSVAGHVAGPQIRDMVDSFARGDVARAAAIHQRLMPLFKGLFLTTNPIPVKAALALQGFPVGGLRLPLVEASEKEREQVRQAMLQSGVLEASQVM